MGLVGLSFVLHNHEGSILLIGHESRASCLDVQSAEAWTILMDLWAILEKNFHPVLIENDTLSVVIYLQFRDKPPVLS